jgi:hypothetical protein
MILRAADRSLCLFSILLNQKDQVVEDNFFSRLCSTAFTAVSTALVACCCRLAESILSFQAPR